MNIAILGMQGAGKTVFISQFFYFLKKHYGNGSIQGLTSASEPYVAGIRDILEGSRTGIPGWPESTKQATLQELSFSVSLKGTNLLLNFADLAGQDIENLLSVNNSSQYTDFEKRLSKMLRNADKIIFLFDLLSRAQQKTHEQQAVDRWIFDKFIKTCNTKDVEGLIVLSKADEFPAISVQDYGNGQKIYDYMHEQLFSEGWNFPRSINRFQYCAVSSVEVETKYGTRGIVTIPKLPLKSAGFESVARYIAKSKPLPPPPPPEVKILHLICVAAVLCTVVILFLWEQYAVYAAVAAILIIVFSKLLLSQWKH